jgi:hypothetical protein
MRWDVVKKSWELARDKFDGVKRLYVETPANFEANGKCRVFDLDSPGDPIGTIAYQTVSENGGSAIKLSLEDVKASVPTGRFAIDNLPIISKTSELKARNSISVPDIMARYPDTKILGEQVAYLIVGHEDGLAGRELEDYDVDDWVLDRGFPPQILDGVKTAMAGIGIVTCRDRRERRFQPGDKIRIVDPNLRDYGEGGQVRDFKTTKDKERDKIIGWYLVLVDGSSEPVWVQEQQLAKNMAGCVNG